MPTRSTPSTAQTQRVNPWIVMAVVGVGNLCSGLMSSSVNVVLPTIRAEFGLDMSVIEWVVTAYMLVTASMLIFYGRLGDIFGHKRIYTIGFGLFTLGSLACGLAPSIEYLIAGRVFQALGAAMVTAVSVALITAAFPPEKRGQALGLYASSVYVGLSLGPTFGGLVSDWIGWQWVFFTIVVVGAICVVLSGWLLPGSSTGTKAGIDPVGAVLFAVALSSLLAVLSRGSGWGWGSPLTLGLVALCLAVSALFIWVEGRVTSPMVDLAMFRNRAFSSGVGSAVINYFLGAVLLFLMPFYMIELRGFAPKTAGLMMSVQAVAMVATAPLSGLLSDRLGSRNLASLGLALQGISLFLVSGLGMTGSKGMILFSLALMGIGVGLFTAPNNNEIMGAAPADRRGLAGSVLAAARTVGSVIGVAVGGAIFRGLQANYLAAGAPAADAFLTGLSGALYMAMFLAVLGIGVVFLRGPHLKVGRNDHGAAG